MPLDSLSFYIIIIGSARDQNQGTIYEVLYLCGSTFPCPNVQIQKMYTSNTTLETGSKLSTRASCLYHREVVLS